MRQLGKVFKLRKVHSPYLEYVRYGSEFPHNRELLRTASNINRELLLHIMEGAGCDSEQAVWLVYYELLLGTKGNVDLSECDPDSAMVWDRTYFGSTFWDHVQDNGRRR
jgi:hypothetical protein